MELLKLINEVENFIKLVNAKRDDIMLVVNQLSVEIDSIIDHLKKFAATNQCSLPPHIVKEFPDLKRRVTVNSVVIINRKIQTIESITVKLYDYIKEMKKTQEKISRLTCEINWTHHASFYTAFERILEWSEKCWKILYFLHTNINNGLKFLACDQSHSAMHLKRVSEIKLYDRSVFQMTSEILHLVTMLKSDLSSRSQINGCFS